MAQYQESTIQKLQELKIPPERVAVLENDVPETDVLAVLDQREATEKKVFALLTRIRGDLGTPPYEASHQSFANKGKTILGRRKRGLVGDGSNRR